MEEINEAVGTGGLDVGALWDDSDVADPVTDQHGEEPAEGTEQTSTGAAAEGQPAPKTGEEGTGEGAKPGEMPADQPGGTGTETYTLKHLDQTRTVNREELVGLAQKGLDYERVRTKYDELQEYKKTADPALTLVKTMATKSGMTVEQYIDYCRQQEIMATGVNEATAKAQVQVEKQQAAIQAQTKAQEAAKATQTAEQQAKEARGRDIDAFLAEYPDVKAEDIPAEVWQAVQGGQSLVTAYTKYQNKLLKAQLAAKEQNQKNAARSPGSMSSQEGTGKKTVADFWDEAGY